MLGRMLIALCLGIWPSFASAQIVIEGGGDDEAPAATGDPAATDASAAGSGAPQSQQPSGIQIEGIVQDEESEVAPEPEPEPEPDPKHLELDDVRESAEEGLRDRLTECLGEVEQPTRHEFSGTFIVLAVVGDVAVRPAKITYSDEMFRSESESPKDAAVKKAVTTRKAAFESCVAETKLELDGILPVPELRLQTSVVWFNEAAILRDVRWIDVATAAADLKR